MGATSAEASDAAPRAAPVRVLLSIHDGAAHLDELLASVRAQRGVDLALDVVDDGSRDGGAGAAIVEAHAALDPRVRLVGRRAPGAAVGPARSYLELLGRVGPGEAFAFCDQDDVWLPDKLAWSLGALGRAPSAVAAVATDAVVVDAGGATLAGSATAAHGVRDGIDLGRLLVNNVAIGATLVGTAELASLAVRLAPSADPPMHDWWCALVAAHAGSLALLARPTLRWRRHAATVTGHGPRRPLARARRRTTTLARSSRMARALADGAPAVDPSAARAVAALAASGERPPGPVELVRLRRAGVRAWRASQQAQLVLACLAARATAAARHGAGPPTTARGDAG